MSDSNITKVSEGLRKPEGWTPPSRPDPQGCEMCRAPVEAEFIEPVFWNGKPSFGTGRWMFAPICPRCQKSKDDEAKEEQEEKQAQERSRKIQELISQAGFKKIHEVMTLDNFAPLFCAETFFEIQKAWDAGKNIFITGPTGVGKTHLSVGLLKNFISSTAQRGLIRNVAEFMLDIRQAIKTHKDADLLNEVSSADALVLDDLGVERPTPTALETLYLLIDRWHNDCKGRLIITTNYDLREISGRLHDRIASRITGMSELFRLDGQDRRMLLRLRPGNADKEA
ncbi:MAG: ATP-binding protein [Elusimicrobia bacterium]|nr:ATP-binding protein [Elusimicrobiota bacterium]